MQYKQDIYYHYTTMDGLFGIIDDKCVRATHIEYLNDPSEDKYFKDILDDYLNRNSNAKKIHNILYNEWYGANFDAKEKFIVSFSKSSDALPMWNFYAKGNGVNIGLNLKKVVNRLQKKKIFVQKIEMIYTEKKQLKYLKTFFNKYLVLSENVEKNVKKLFVLESMDGIKFGEKTQERYEKMQDSILCYMNEYDLLKKRFKHIAYSNEEEIRLIVEYDEDINRIRHRTTRNGLVIPFIEIQLELNNELAEVWLHPLQSELASKGVFHFLENHLIQDVKIERSRIPFRHL